MVKYSGSDSDSDHSRRRRRRSKSRSRSGSSSSSHSRSGSRHSYRRKHTPKCKKKHHSRRSRSRERVRDRRGRDYRSRTRSPSGSRSSSRKIKSHSRDRDRRSRSSDRRSRSVSPRKIHKKRRRRSRSRSSGSRSSRKDYRSTRCSRSNSPNKSPPSSTVSASNSHAGASGLGDFDSEQQLRIKLQRAIEAAKTADEQLRQQGVLPAGSSRSSKREVEMSALEQLSRANKIEEINDDSFVPKVFHSTRSEKPEKEEIAHVVGEFSFGTQAERLATDAVEVLNRLGHLDKEGLCHPRLFMDAKQKEERWLKKLFNFRQKALQGDPL